ncbi:MAG: hypothetical protein JWN01_851 [Patescibacteria group bacterium]|nr:hypothetical protein [Patescibacteria group bacterium]
MTTTIAVDVAGPVHEGQSRFYLTTPPNWGVRENAAGRLMKTARTFLVRAGDEKCKRPVMLEVTVSRPCEPLDGKLTELVLEIDLSAGSNSALTAGALILGRCTTSQLPNGTTVRNDQPSLPDRATPNKNGVVKFYTWVRNPLSNLYLEIR